MSGRALPAWSSPRNARVVFMTLIFLSGSARAHTRGLSLAEFDVEPNGEVDARLTFASDELLGDLALDRDRDGIVTSDDVAAARDDLRAFLLDGVAVEADGSGCTASFRDASLTEVDGLVLEASYDCPSDAAEIAVTLYYLSSPGGGKLHAPYKGIARIVAGSATTEGVLTGEHRAIALRLPGNAHGARRKPLRAVAVVAAGIVVALLLWSTWSGRRARRARRARRWREARASWQNRTP